MIKSGINKHIKSLNDINTGKTKHLILRYFSTLMILTVTDVSFVAKRCPSKKNHGADSNHLKLVWTSGLSAFKFINEMKVSIGS